MSKTAQEKAKEDLLKKANDTPSVQGAPSTDPDSGSDLLDKLDKDPDSNRAKAEKGAEEAEKAQTEKPRLVGSPIAPKPTKGKYSDSSKDGDRGEDKPHPHLDNTDVEDKLSEVHEHGKTPEGMRAGAEASVPKTDQSLSEEDAKNLDLDGIKKALTTARNKVRTATENGVKLTREEFDEHLEVTQMAQEVSNLLGNLR